MVLISRTQNGFQHLALGLVYCIAAARLNIYDLRSEEEKPCGQTYKRRGRHSLSHLTLSPDGVFDPSIISSDVTTDQSDCVIACTLQKDHWQDLLSQYVQHSR